MSICKQWKIYYWPLVTSGFILSTFILMYIIAVLLDHHVYPLYPYISDTGTIPPESCIFAQLFNISGLILFITIYIRYKQIEFAINSGNIKLKTKWNNIAFRLGICMSMGMSVVGNFQETSIEVVHFIGAFMALGVGLIYFALQTIISLACYKARRNSIEYAISKSMLCLRIFLTITLILMFNVCGVTGIVARLQFTGERVYYWTEKDGGFTYRLVSTFSEWVVGIAMVAYIATFTSEFKTMKFGGIVFTNLLDENINDKEKLQEPTKVEA